SEGEGIADLTGGAGDRDVDGAFRGHVRVDSCGDTRRLRGADSNKRSRAAAMYSLDSAGLGSHRSGTIAQGPGLFTRANISMKDRNAVGRLVCVSNRIS